MKRLVTISLFLIICYASYAKSPYNYQFIGETIVTDSILCSEIPVYVINPTINSEYLLREEHVGEQCIQAGKSTLAFGVFFAIIGTITTSVGYQSNKCFEYVGIGFLSSGAALISVSIPLWTHGNALKQHKF